MDERPPTSSQSRSTPGAAFAIFFLVLVIIGAAAFALRGTASGVSGLSKKVGDFVTELKQGHESPAASDAPAPDATTTDAAPAMEVPANPTQAPGERVRAATQLQRIKDTVAECVPTLMQFAQNVRLIAADISPDNVDLVQESASVPGRFVRMGCEWDGHSTYNVSDNGRMIVPKRVVSDTSQLSAGELLPADYLDGEWLTARVSAAARSALPPRSDAVRRIELSFVQEQGVLTRVQFEGQPQRTVVVGPEDRIMPASQFFPQVERFHDVTEESAALGYRDKGNMIYTSGLSGTIDSLPKDYFDPNQRYFALAFAGRHGDVYLPATGAAPVQHIELDEYGDAQEPEKMQRDPRHCDRPFTYADAHAALVKRMKERGETLEQFEQHDFGTAEFDCRESPRAPTWKLGNG